jgi:hypothetical protein
MAPIPALWVAASLADRNVIAVGDFKHLPIVQSKHEVALKWLGQDMFDISGMTSARKQRCPPPHFVTLKERKKAARSTRNRAALIGDNLILRTQSKTTSL